ncbi:hypothetical protein [Luteimonas salinilitoris]|uniref:Uncharacterized protein n=1 Tax=Luteimonas salinilitoris TaxID=3237697 RepID=A0ABV4HP99_9GAMM
MEHGQNNRCWDDRDVPRPESYCADYDWQRGKPSDALTAVALYPRFAGVAPPERARRTAVAAHQHLLRPGGEGSANQEGLPAAQACKCLSRGSESGPAPDSRRLNKAVDGLVHTFPKASPKSVKTQPQWTSQSGKALDR